MDTNVLVQYFTGQDPVAFQAVDQAMERARTDGEKFFVTGLVLCELDRLLSHDYGMERAAVANVLDQLMHLDLFEIENRELALRAMEQYRGGAGDFADYLMSHIGRRAGCRDTLTLDPLIKRERGFSAP